jgi:hypothetical protein
MSEMDFEMLGRYTAAKEQADKLVLARQRVLWELKTLINGDHSPEDVKKIDWLRAGELLGAAEKLDGELNAAWDAANAAAEVIGRARLGYRR